MKNNKGFTLIELLVVIAIIAVLTFIVMSGLVPARTKSRVNSVLQSLTSVKTAVYACLQAGGDMVTPVPAEPICNDSFTDATQIWPTLPTDWVYLNSAVSDPEAGTYTFEAGSAEDAFMVTCTETGCSVHQ